MMLLLLIFICIILSFLDVVYWCLTAEDSFCKDNDFVDHPFVHRKGSGSVLLCYTVCATFSSDAWFVTN